MKESKIWITEHIEQIHGEINLKKRVITIKKTIDNFAYGAWREKDDLLCSTGNSAQYYITVRA